MPCSLFIPWLFLWCLLVWIGPIAPVQAGPLAERLAAFPQWQSRPPVQAAQGDLFYPAWLEGTWAMTSVLESAIAPLAPEVVTPGFASNQAMVGQPITCPIRFIPGPTGAAGKTVISDRAFNGYQLAIAYLGAEQIKAVKVDPRNPNRQITWLRGDRALESTVLGRGVERIEPGGEFGREPGEAPGDAQGETFITSELFQQVFRGIPQPYLNEVENTTAYTYHPDHPTTPITADQVTAIYLSPQDSQYDFSRRDRPVALYRYHLTFEPEHGSPPAG